MKRERSLCERMYSDPCYTAVVRAIGYEGCVYRDLAERLGPLVQEFGEGAVETATRHLLSYEGQVLRNAKPLADVKLCGEARKFAVGLLGFPPEHPWHDAVRNGERIPLPWEAPDKGAPKQEVPPQEEEMPGEKESEDEGEIPPSPAGVTAEAHAQNMRTMNRRQLLCTLRDARRKLAKQGKRSFSGKEAKKEIAAAEKELRRRGLPVPPHGQETAEWDKKK